MSLRFGSTAAQRGYGASHLATAHRSAQRGNGATLRAIAHRSAQRDDHVVEGGQRIVHLANMR